MLPSSTDLGYFIEVSHTKNLSRASERLGVSQPTLSQSLKRLEEQLGAALVVRTKTGVRLTKTGDRMVAQARNLLEQWDRLRTESVRDEEELRGRYVLGCHPSVALYSLPYVLPKLIEEHPELEIHLIHDLSRKIVEDVISFKTDFGIVVNPTQHPDLVIKLLCKDKVGLWTSKKASKLQDPYSGKGVLVMEPNLVQAQMVLKKTKRLGMNFGRLITSSNLEVISSIVEQGLGVGILPARVAGRFTSVGLKLIKDSPLFVDRHCLVYRADAQSSKASRKLARSLEAFPIWNDF